MKSTTSARVKTAPRDSFPEPADSFSSAAATTGEYVRGESRNKSKFSWLGEKFIFLVEIGEVAKRILGFGRISASAGLSWVTIPALTEFGATPTTV
ncbi:MAG: hypothetical protein KGZ83_03175 [Sulfuricella sp.]|nr:hypothetical protein [Sulfuricella sp.]